MEKDLATEAIRNAFRRQAIACERLGSPFTARVSRLHANRLDRGSPVADCILNWQGDPSPSADSVPLRIAGALHALVLEGKSAQLAATYPPNAVDDETLWVTIRAAETEHADFILDRMNSAPQTNEVRRSGVLLPGFLLIDEMFGKPLVLSEVGASAGLNLQWDRYHHDIGDRSFGPAGSPVRISPEWRGASAPAGCATVASRAGCDLNPVLATDPNQRLRMLSYIWADQADRLERTARALDVAAREGLEIVKGDAVDWLLHRLAETQPSRTHVIFHTIAWQYLPKWLQDKGNAVIAEAGARATPQAPLARLAFEADNEPGGAALTLQIWPSGESRQIGRGDFHGRWVEWRGW